MSSYECDYSEENSLQKRKQEIEEASVIPRLNPRLFCEENGLEFLVEALFFVIIVAISAWPILAAAGALHEFFQRAIT
jgi:cell fate (sporulation/competence/biofilm development) regulator YlbF (YheA/YmcA/DUF963 family)